MEVMQSAPGAFKCRLAHIGWAWEALMLEFDDIQYILVTRVPALTGRYEFLSFRSPPRGAPGSRPYGKSTVGESGR